MSLEHLLPLRHPSHRVHAPVVVMNENPLSQPILSLSQGAVDAIHRVLLAASSVQGGIGIIKLGSGFMCAPTPPQPSISQFTLGPPWDSGHRPTVLGACIF